MWDSFRRSLLRLRLLALFDLLCFAELLFLFRDGAALLALIQADLEFLSRFLFQAHRSNIPFEGLVSLLKNEFVVAGDHQPVLFSRVNNEHRALLAKQIFRINLSR